MYRSKAINENRQIAVIFYGIKMLNVLGDDEGFSSEKLMDFCRILVMRIKNT